MRIGFNLGSVEVTIIDTSTDELDEQEAQEWLEQTREDMRRAAAGEIDWMTREPINQQQST